MTTAEAERLAARIRENMRQRTTEELLGIWCQNDREQYSEVTFEIVKEELTARGISPPTQEPGTARFEVENAYRGVHGWLLFFCLSLVLFNPLVALAGLCGSAVSPPANLSAVPGLTLLVLADSLASIGLAGYSVLAGVRLWTLRPNAVTVVRQFLLTSLAYALVSPTLPFLFGVPWPVNKHMAFEIAKASVRAVIYVLVWGAYLASSKRVKVTYGAAGE